MWKLTIYCCYHVKSQKIDDDPLTRRFYGPWWLLNAYLSEFSMFYDIWKNDKDSDYIWTCHYRRRIYSSDFNKDLVKNDSCQVYEIVYGNWYSWAFWIQKWSSNKRRKCPRIREDYKEYLTQIETGEKYLKMDKIIGTEKYFMIPRSSVILTRNHFMRMCDFIFGFLEFLDKKYKLNYDWRLYDEWIMTNYLWKTKGWLPYWLKYNINNVKRLLAYLFERLVSIYIQTNIDTYCLINPRNRIQVYPWTWWIIWCIIQKIKSYL